MKDGIKMRITATEMLIRDVIITLVGPYEMKKINTILNNRNDEVVKIIDKYESALKKISDRCCEPCSTYADEALEIKK